MNTVLLVIHFFIALFLVGSILLQRSEGGALSGLGGGGLMTTRGTANLLTRVTAVLAALFFLSSLFIAIKLRSPDGGSSLLNVEDEKPAVTKTVQPEEVKPETKAEEAGEKTTPPVEQTPAASIPAEGSEVKK